MTDIPHFTFPLQFDGKRIAEVEQDSLDEIAGCVQAICSTPLGWFPEVPEFGIPDLTFRVQPVGSDDLAVRIEEQEPRASVVAEEQPDFYDTMIARVNLYVNRGDDV